MFTRVKYSSIQTQLVIEILFIGRSWELQHEITIWSAWVNGLKVDNADPRVLSALNLEGGYHIVNCIN